jgi:hypothetical protein
LFFDLAAQGPQGSIEPGRFEPILRAILPTLEFTVRQFFTTVGREYDRSNRALPPGQVTIPRPQIEYIPEALKLLGINGFSSNPGKPELHLFLGDYLFIVRSAKNDWKWSVALPFLEEQRFVPKVHIGNVIHGTTGSRFHEICNDFNQRYAPVKSFCLVEAGQVYLIASGRIPFVSLQQVAEGLKHVFDLLYSCKATPVRKGRSRDERVCHPTGSAVTPRTSDVFIEIEWMDAFDFSPHAANFMIVAIQGW